MAMVALVAGVDDVRVLLLPLLHEDSSGWYLRLRLVTGCVGLCLAGWTCRRLLWPGAIYVGRVDNNENPCPVLTTIPTQSDKAWSVVVCIRKITVSAPPRR